MSNIQKVTVGFLTYDRKHKAAMSLASLVTQPECGEILIADNGYDNHLPQDFWHVVALAKMKGIKVRYEATLTSLSKARKWVYENASCPAVLLSDDDSIYESEFLANAIDSLNFGYDAVHGLVNNLTDFEHQTDGAGGIQFSSLRDRLDTLPALYEYGHTDYVIRPFGGTMVLRTGLSLYSWADKFPDLADDVILLTELVEKKYKVLFKQSMIAHHLRDSIRAYAGGETVWKMYKERGKK